MGCGASAAKYAGSSIREVALTIDRLKQRGITELEGLVTETAEQAAERHEMELCENLWNRVDTDGNGTLEPYELQRILVDMNRSLTPEQLQTVSNTLDADGSGKVDRQEFLEWFRRGVNTDWAELQKMEAKGKRAMKKVRRASVTLMTMSDPTRSSLSAALADGSKQAEYASASPGEIAMQQVIMRVESNVDVVEVLHQFVLADVRGEDDEVRKGTLGSIRTREIGAVLEALEVNLPLDQHQALSNELEERHTGRFEVRSVCI